MDDGVWSAPLADVLDASEVVDACGCVRVTLILHVTQVDGRGVVVGSVRDWFGRLTVDYDCQKRTCFDRSLSEPHLRKQTTIEE